MSAPALKAYAVTHHDDDQGGIVFTRHAVVARRQGANLYDGDFDSMSCRRVPWADAYAGRDVPAKVMLEHGWWLECMGCGVSIPEPDEAIGTQDRPYCTKACCRRDMSITRRRRAQEQAAIEAFQAIVRRRFPEAIFAGEHQHACIVARRGGWHRHQVVVHFRLPCLKHPATLRLDDNRGPGPHPAAFWCATGDREEFKALLAIEAAS